MPNPVHRLSSAPEHRLPGESALAVLFCAVLFTGLVSFSVRWILRTQAGPAVRSSPLARFILATGADDVAGSPRPGRTLREDLEWETTVNVPFRIPLLEAASAWERFIGWNVPLLSGYNSVFDAGGGFLGRNSYSSPTVLKTQEDAVLRLIKTIGEIFPNTPLLYVIPPARFGPADDLVDSVFDFSNEIRDRLIPRLQEVDAEVLDLRVAWANTGRKPREAFFWTDHHFTPETGLWAARQIGEELFGRYGIPVATNALADEAFRERVYKRTFLGSLGKQFTLARCKPDDIALIGTVAPSDFEIDIPFRRVHARGDSKSLICWRHMKGRSPYDHNPYGAYLFSDNPQVRIRNHGLLDGPRLLLFADSFDNALSSFLAAGVGFLETVDLRHWRDPVTNLAQEGPFNAIVVFWNEPPPANHLVSVARWESLSGQ